MRERGRHVGSQVRSVTPPALTVSLRRAGGRAARRRRAVGRHDAPARAAPAPPLAAAARPRDPGPEERGALPLHLHLLISN